jgi:hypothetical protein
VPGAHHTATSWARWPFLRCAGVRNIMFVGPAAQGRILDFCQMSESSRKHVFEWRRGSGGGWGGWRRVIEGDYPKEQPCGMDLGPDVLAGNTTCSCRNFGDFSSLNPSRGYPCIVPVSGWSGYSLG